MINNDRLRDLAAVMVARADGRTVQYGVAGSGNWTDFNGGPGEFLGLLGQIGLEFRIKLQPARKELEFKDVRPGWILRFRSRLDLSGLIVFVSPDGVNVCWGDHIKLITFMELFYGGSEYSPDSGQTWHPCWKEEA